MSRSTPANLVIVHAEGDSPAEVQDVVAIALDPRLAHLFGGDGVALAHLEPIADKPRNLHS